MATFKLGRVVAETSVNKRMQSDRVFAAFVSKSLRRYQECDWGDTCKEGKESNDHAIDNDERVLAVYTQDPILREPVTIWIITESDRSITTVLFPEEY